MKIACLVGLLCIFSPIRANSQELPDVNWLISEVVNKAIRNDEVKKLRLQFTKQEVVRNLNKIGPDGRGEITNKGKDKPSPRGVGLANDDPKLNPQDISTRNHEFKYSVPYIQIDNRGRRYYQVSFQPKKKHQNGANGYITGAYRSSGTMYIDADHLYVIKLEAEMPESEAYLTWGVIRIKWFHTEIRQEFRPDLNNLVVIESVITKAKYKVIIPSFYEQYEYVYSNYRYVK